MSSRPVPVLIPTLNEAAHIAGVIRALAADPPAQGLRFLICDGGSTDATRSIALALNAEGHEVEVVDNPRRIQAAGVNIAALALGPEDPVFVRCDAHAGYPGGFIRQVLETLAEQGADSVVAPMDSVGHGCTQKAVAWVSNSPVGTGGSRHRAGRESGWVDHGHHVAFVTARFQALGGYDERFVANEDAEFDARLREVGGRIYLNAETRIVYYPRATLRALARQYYRYGCGRACTVRLHPDSLRLRQGAVPAAMLGLAVCLVLAPVAPVTLLWPALYAAILAATALAIAFSRRSLCGLVCGPAAFVMHAAWAAGFLGTLPRGRLAPWSGFS